MSQTVPYAQLFESGSVAGQRLSNRLVLAPMTRTSAEPDGRATARMRDYYRDFAKGGFGLVITEGTYTDERYSQGYLNQPGLANEAQRQAWQPVVEAVKGEGAMIVAQLMHGGGQTQGNRFVDETVAPSAVAPKGEMLSFYGGEGPYPTPRAMTEQEILDVIDGFVASAQHARQAGFDGVEIHAANGYLLDQFISTDFNQRDDAWGGSLDKRLALPVAVIRAVREAVGPDFLVGMRLSQVKVTDPEYRWAGREEATHILRTLGNESLDYLHFSEIDATAPALEGIDKSLASFAKEFLNLPVIANGSLGDPAKADELIANRQADFVAIGKAALANRDWPQRVRHGHDLREIDFAMLMPRANLANEDQWREQQGVFSTHHDG